MRSIRLIRLSAAVILGAFILQSLSGCILFAAGAGAGGGVYVDRNYKVEKKDKTDSSSTKSDSADKK